LYKRYNQSRELQERQRTFDPDFWEIGVDHDRLGMFSASEGMYYESEVAVAEREEKEAWVERMMPRVRVLMRERLTERQEQIVRPYFLDQMTEREIARLLGISTSSVSQHLFGKLRNGKRVGGAIPKLRKYVVEKSVSSAFRTD